MSSLLAWTWPILFAQSGFSTVSESCQNKQETVVHNTTSLSKWVDSLYVSPSLFSSSESSCGQFHIRIDFKQSVPSQTSRPRRRCLLHLQSRVWDCAPEKNLTVRNTPLTFTKQAVCPTKFCWACYFNRVKSARELSRKVTYIQFGEVINNHRKNVQSMPGEVSHQVKQVLHVWLVKIYRLVHNWKHLHQSGKQYSRSSKKGKCVVSQKFQTIVCQSNVSDKTPHIHICWVLLAMLLTRERPSELCSASDGDASCALRSQFVLQMPPLEIKHQSIKIAQVFVEMFSGDKQGRLSASRPRRVLVWPSLDAVRIHDNRGLYWCRRMWSCSRRVPTTVTHRHVVMERARERERGIVMVHDNDLVVTQKSATCRTHNRSLPGRNCLTIILILGRKCTMFAVTRFTTNAW